MLSEQFGMKIDAKVAIAEQPWSDIQFIHLDDDGTLINSVMQESSPYIHELVAIFLETLGIEGVYFATHMN